MLPFCATIAKVALPELKGTEQVHRIHVYLPARTAVVLARRRGAE